MFSNMLLKQIILVLVLTHNIPNIASLEYVRCTTNSSNIHPFCLPDSYDKDIDPDPKPNAPLDIYVHLVIEDIIKINDYDTTVSLRSTIFIGWTDNRIKILSNSSKWVKEDEEENWTKLNPNWINYLWLPDVEILNMKQLKIPAFVTEPKGLELYESKRIWYDFPAELTITCPLFDYEKYPFDRQVCKIMMGSYQYYASEMKFKGSVIYKAQNQRPLQYKIMNVKKIEENDSIASEKEYWLTKDGTIESDDYNYSRFVVVIELERSIQQHIMRTYLPTSLFVMSSWIGFFIDIGAIPGRITLSVTMLLVLTQISTDLDHHTPKSDKINAVQIWALFCIVMVFFALLEYGLILWIRFGRKNGSISQVFDAANKSKKRDSIKYVNHMHESKEADKTGVVKPIYRIDEKSIDQICITIFPLSFAIFNIIYWYTFM